MICVLYYAHAYSGFDLVPGVVDKEKSIAYGIYNDTVNETG